MIRYKKAKAKNKPMLIEYKLLTIIPYTKDDSKKLEIIAYVNNMVSKNYKDFTIIYHFFKPIGIYLIKDKELDTLFICEKYRNKGIGSKLMKNIQDKIETIKVKKENKKAIKFYKQNGFVKEERNKDSLILRKGD